MVEIKELVDKAAFEKYLLMLGNRDVYCIFGGRPEWDDKQQRYTIPPTSPRKRTEWVHTDELFDRLLKYVGMGWTVWVSLNDKEEGNDTIAGVDRIYCIWFDFDPQRDDKAHAATDEQKAKAYDAALKFRNEMKNHGVIGFIACSGNGYHVFFPLDPFSLPAQEFRREFNEKMKRFYQELREKTHSDFDVTGDIRRVTQPIGFPNMKIPDEPVMSGWVDRFTEEDVERARKVNFSFIETILNTKLNAADPQQVTATSKSIQEVLEKSQKMKEVYEGKWGKYGYKSRSEAEEAVVTFFCSEGLSDAQINEAMMSCGIGKWQEKDAGYQSLTIKKAREYVGSSKTADPNAKDNKKAGSAKEKEDNSKPEIEPILEDLMERYIFITTSDTEDIFVYNEGIYEPGEQKVKEEVEKILGEKASTYTVTEIMNHIRRRTYVPREIFNADKRYIALANGLLDLEAMQITPFDPSRVFTSKLPVEYDPEAKCPNIENFIRSVVREEDMPVVQEFFGYCLYPSMPAAKTLWLYGTGRNGKTTLAKLFLGLISPKNAVSIPLEEFDGQHRFTKARLFGKLVNVVSEPGVAKLLLTSEFKQITGGDLITAEVKNKQSPIEFVNTAKMIVLGNLFPQVNDTSDAFWERIILIDFPNQFTDTSIPDYEKVVVEMDGGYSGFLNWCLEGLKRLKGNNFHFTESKTSEKYKSEFEKVSDSIAAFINEVLEKDSDGEVSKAELYDSYKTYCEREGLTIMPKINLSKRIGEISWIYESTFKKDGKTTRGWKGLRCKQVEEEVAEAEVDGNKQEAEDQKKDLDYWKKKEEEHFKTPKADDNVVLLVEQDCPDFVDPETKQKYHLKKGDVINIKKWVGDILVKAQKARAIGRLEK